MRSLLINDSAEQKGSISSSVRHSYDKMSFRGFSEPRQGGRGRGQRGDGNRGSFGRRRDPSNQRGRGGGGPLQPDKRNVCPPDYIFR